MGARARAAGRSGSGTRIVQANDRRRFAAPIVGPYYARTVACGIERGCMVRGKGVLDEKWCEVQAVTESNHHEARRCQPKSPWRGEIPGGMTFMKTSPLYKIGALKVPAGVGMDLVVV
jgi:hypothetical protein